MTAVEYACTVKPSDTLTVELGHEDGLPVVAFIIESAEREQLSVCLGHAQLRELAVKIAHHYGYRIEPVAA